MVNSPSAPKSKSVAFLLNPSTIEVSKFLGRAIRLSNRNRINNLSPPSSPIFIWLSSGSFFSSLHIKAFPSSFSVFSTKDLITDSRSVPSRRVLTSRWKLASANGLPCCSICLSAAAATLTATSSVLTALTNVL